MAATARFDKHPTLWFDDGNVVLIAENTGFRVYRGVLAKHSEIFRDMFLLPHPDSELAIEDTYDGCPIVRMAEDEAHEWEVVLGVLYTMSECKRFYDRGTQLPFSTVVAALRLGLKYTINEIKDESLRRLRKCYPKKLENNHWEIHLATDSDSSATSQSSKDASVCQMVWKPRNSIAVLHLARQFGLDELVPAALYACAIGLSSADLVSAASNQEHGLYALTQPELIECYQVRESLSTDNLGLYDVLSQSKVSINCSRQQGSKQSCTSIMAAMIGTAHTLKMMQQHNVLTSLDSLLACYRNGSKSLCMYCFPHVSREMYSRQKQALSNFRKLYCPKLGDDDDSESGDSDESSMDED